MTLGVGAASWLVALVPVRPESRLAANPRPIQTVEIANAANASRLVLRSAEPFVVDLLIGAVLTKRDQREIDLSAKRTIQLHHDGCWRSVNFRTDRLHPALSLMSRIVKE